MTRGGQESLQWRAYPRPHHPVHGVVRLPSICLLVVDIHRVLFLVLDIKSVAQ